MRQNHFDSDLDQLFAPDSESDPFWVWARAAFWASMLALLVSFWSWAGSSVLDFLGWAFA